MARPASTLRHRASLYITVLVLSCIALHAQTQASCTFKLFSPSGWKPSAINDWGTVVGGGIIMLGGEFIEVPYVTLIDRDDNGNTLSFGVEWSLLDPRAYVTIELFSLGNLTPVGQVTPGHLNEFAIRRRNNWDSAVGAYLDAHSKMHGFKRWSSGSYVTLDYPKSSSTNAEAINDLGAVVGSYTDAGQKQHGFIYAGGQWATLDYPQASATDLVGIANGGTIVGNAQVNGAGVAFLYCKGTFKTISVSNSPANSTMMVGSSLKKGLIVGTYANGAFKGTCR